MSLASELDKARTEIVGNINSALAATSAAAAKFDMQTTIMELAEVKDLLNSDTFKIIVIGRFKNGKSTLMNALLGKMTHALPELGAGQGAMPTNDLPTTATLTSIDYGESPSVKVWKTSGKREVWSLEKYLRESTVKDDETINASFFREIRQFEMKLPAELCKSGVTLLDSPGLDDVPMRTEVTKKAVETADAAILVYRSDVLAGKSERDFTEDVLYGGTRVFTIVNMWNGKQTDERFNGFVWNRLVKDAKAGPAYSGQAMQTHDIYPVDAYKAEQGKMRDDDALIAESGIVEFEARLAKFLVNERYETHVGKYLRRAEIIANGIVTRLNMQREALKRDSEELQAAYDRIQPELAVVRRRRDDIPSIFKRYRREAEFELRTSFEQLMSRIPMHLEYEIKGKTLPTIEKWTVFGAAYMQGAICKEAIAACNEIIMEHLEKWGSTGGQTAIEPVLSRLLDEVREEVAEIDRGFGDIRVELTGWTPSAEQPTSLVTMQERVLTSAASLMLGQVSTAVFGASGGWRSAAGGLAAEIGMATLLVGLGVTGSVVIIPAVVIAGMIASVFAGGSGLEKRVKDKAIEISLAELGNAPQKALGAIESEVKRIFAEVEAGIMESVGSIVEEEERNILQIISNNRMEQGEKQQKLELIDEVGNTIGEQERFFKNVVVAARQTAAL